MWWQQRRRKRNQRDKIRNKWIQLIISVEFVYFLFSFFIFLFFLIWLCRFLPPIHWKTFSGHFSLCSPMSSFQGNSASFIPKSRSGGRLRFRSASSASGLSAGRLRKGTWHLIPRLTLIFSCVMKRLCSFPIPRLTILFLKGSRWRQKVSRALIWCTSLMRMICARRARKSTTNGAAKNAAQAGRDWLTSAPTAEKRLNARNGSAQNALKP